MNLTDLLTAAASGAGTLTDEHGRTAEVRTSDAARLYAAVADDAITMGLGLLNTPTASVVLEDAGTETVVVAGVLRYVVGDGVERLCTAATCPGGSIGTSLITRVCREHLDTPVPGLTPPAADDIRPGDLQAAIRDSRTLRLDAWQREIAGREQEAAGDRRLLEALRQTIS
ncbi:hypothetical protein ACFWFV_28310 [Streptomyces diastaticus]|uniref:hypothetical protein n=1 Tax=Streptomyces diastaticus TaxID=1956 RepID=UPI00364BEBAA